jgi:ribosomal protein L37AE/L43A
MARVKTYQAPVCPNNSRHGLRPDSRGGYRCDACTEELAGTRSRLPTRWAFATLDETHTPSLESVGEGLPSAE